MKIPKRPRLKYAGQKRNNSQKFRFYDDDRNELTVEGNTIKLKLTAEARARTLGVIQSGLLLTERKAKHLHKKSNSYGFNYYLLNNAKRFDTVRLQTPEAIYLIPVKSIIDLGDFLHFKKRGFERQIFMRLDLLHNFKIDSEL